MSIDTFPVLKFEPIEFMHPSQRFDTGASFVIISVMNTFVPSHSCYGLTQLNRLREDVKKLINKIHATSPNSWQYTDYPDIQNVIGCFEGAMELSLAIEMKHAWFDEKSIRKLLKKYHQECALWVEGNHASLIHKDKLKPTEYIGKWTQCENNIPMTSAYTQSLLTGITYEVDYS